ncbi:MAG TPA: MJ1477/TM1410 family putative glycoside hydrolase [Spirochaetia bacterium]|nr:MJ1477/TM1410 family putative glycoside hydrolase [Spirochaetia bacterium]
MHSTGVRHWAYWLANVDPQVVAQSPFEMIIVDYSADGSGAKAFGPAEVAQMQRKPDRSRRLVLAYLSVGEAEDYRYYWNPDWFVHPPVWLDEENPSWKGNYKVHYWNPEWQKTMYGSPSSYLDKIIAAGFDGVMLDIVDAFDYYSSIRPQSDQEMIDFVASLSDYAKARHPGFLIFPQNAEALLADSHYLSKIDGVTKEDLYFGVRRDGVRNSAGAITYSISFLDRVLAVGKPVFVVEYLRRPSQVDEFYQAARAAGLIPYAARRDLSSLTINRLDEEP